MWGDNFTTLTHYSPRDIQKLLWKIPIATKSVISNGCSLNDDFGDIISRLRDNSLIEDNGQELSMSELGKLVYDLVTVCFYPQTA